MTEPVKLNLRRKQTVFFPQSPSKGYTYGPQPEEVDLDTLTPRARALAEAFDQCGGRPLEVVMEQSKTIRETVRNWQAYYTPEKASQRNRKVIRDWSRLRPPAEVADLPDDVDVPRRAAAQMTAVEWLEREARTWPLDWYVVSAVGCDPVPSMEAGAADQALTREAVLDYMRERGHPMDIKAWDTLRGTGHLPDPDRYVCGLPQWKPDSIEAYVSRDRELWPISQVAAELGYSGPSATGTARKQLHRWGIAAEGRGPGRGGESLFPADQILAARAARPGRGARTDLQGDR
uniref:hypothetical protein n=1 Tax=Streptomyces tubercidicus TaxID=47759 RepID=UPI0030E095E5